LDSESGPEADDDRPATTDDRPATTDHRPPTTHAVTLSGSAISGISTLTDVPCPGTLVSFKW
jgi:hypothetical protein